MKYIRLLCALFSLPAMALAQSTAPATQPTWTGAYSNDELKMELTVDSGGLASGSIKMNGNDFPLTGRAVDGLSGTFRGLDGIAVPFTAKMQETHLLLDVNDHHYDLTREGSAATQTQVYGGIGAAVQGSTNGGPLRIIQIVPSGPAEGAGLKVGDRIQMMDDKPVGGMELSIAIGKIRGPEGSEIKLNILHADGSVDDVTLKRKHMDVTGLPSPTPVFPANVTPVPIPLKPATQPTEP